MSSFESFKSIGNGLDQLERAIESCSEGELDEYLSKLMKIHNKGAKRKNELWEKRLEEERRERKLLQVEEMRLLVNKLFEKDAELQEVRVSRGSQDGWRGAGTAVKLYLEVDWNQYVDVKLEREWTGDQGDERLEDTWTARLSGGPRWDFSVTDEQKEVGVAAEKFFWHNTEIHGISFGRKGKILTRASKKVWCRWEDDEDSDDSTSDSDDD